MWQKLKNNRDWIMIILGLLLIVVAALNLINFDRYFQEAELNTTPAVEQEGFVPLLVPVAAADQAIVLPTVASPEEPTRLVIPKIALDAPVELAPEMEVDIDGEKAMQFLVPEKLAVGWHEGSAPLGVPGNTVLNGHHNTFGQVFKDLVNLEVGDTFTVYSGDKTFDYRIANRMILPERDQPLKVRLENGRWIMPSKDERVTLVTCWPARSNTHRLILVAVRDKGIAELEKEKQTPTPTPTEQFYLTTPGIMLFNSPTPSATPTLEATATNLATVVPTQQTQPVISPVDSITSTPVPPPGQSGFSVKNPDTSSVNIREQPDRKSKILGSFKAGGEATGYGRSSDGTWIYIEYQSIKGWVSAEFVQVSVSSDYLPTVVTQ